MESFSKYELIGLLRAAKANRERDWLMILVAYWHGLRASEVVALTADSCQDGFLIVGRLKGSKRTTQVLIRHQDPLLDEATGMFDFVRGMRSNQRLFPVHRSTFWRLVRLYGKIAGIPAHKCHPHSLKHSVARHHIDSLGVHRVQRILGHKSLASTGKYLEFEEAEAGAALQDSARRLIV